MRGLSLLAPRVELVSCRSTAFGSRIYVMKDAQISERTFPCLGNLFPGLYLFI
jgi:hypothetical protein